MDDVGVGAAAVFFLTAIILIDLVLLLCTASQSLLTVACVALGCSSVASLRKCLCIVQNGFLSSVLLYVYVRVVVDDWFFKCPQSFLCSRAALFFFLVVDHLK